MSYRIERDEPVGDAVRRIAGEQVERALGELDAGDLHEAVHQARKRCKKIRSALRLVRPALGDTYRRENAWYRDTARLLSDVRDAAAVVETFDTQVAEPYADQLDDRLLEGARGALAQRRDRLVGTLDRDGLRREAVERLTEGSARMDGWELDAGGWEALGPGLAKTYRRARRRMREALEARRTELLHEWRKRAKYHRHHTRLLAGVWPEALEARRRAARELTDLLGDDHDLAVLRALLGDEDLLLPAADRQALAGVIDARRAHLQAAAGPVGSRLFVEPAEDLARRLGAYWAAWRGDDLRAA